MINKVYIATGGTGGHINPALALADILKKQYPDCQITFFGSSNRMEADVIPAHGYPFHGMKMSGMNGGVTAKLKSLFSLLAAERQCRKLLKQERPDICIGFGNYISVPLIMAAHKLHLPTMIHEQNSFAGKANKMLSRYADAAVGCYDENQSSFVAERFRNLGNPEATLAVEKETADLYGQYGLDRNKPLVFFMMGSLGSETVSAVIDRTCALLPDDLQVLIAAGKENPYRFTAKRDNIRIESYVDGASALKLADLSVTRAGATTICEITALGVPSILVPSPYVPNNHQVFNAMKLVDKNAARMIEEKDLTPEKLAETIVELINDPQAREAMKVNAAEQGKPAAAYEMIKWMEELV